MLNREAACLRLDPYANAFYDFVNGVSDADRAHPRFGVHADDATAMRPELHQRKYELDTLAAFLRLSVGYHRAGGDTAAYGAGWLEAVRRVVATIREQQMGSDEEDAAPGGPAYTFRRVTPLRHRHAGPPRAAASPPGAAASPRAPSAPATTRRSSPSPIAANAMAAVGLRGVADLIDALALDAPLAAHCRNLGDELAAAIASQRRRRAPDGGSDLRVRSRRLRQRVLHGRRKTCPACCRCRTWAGASPDDPVYLRTRAFLWSEDNPYFIRGSAAEGIGGPHVGRANLWPMSLLIHALTETDPAEADRDLATLCRTHAGRRVMHETFHRDDAGDYTRPWFCWPNALFAELVMRRYGAADRRPFG